MPWPEQRGVKSKQKTGDTTILFYYIFFDPLFYGSFCSFISGIYIQRVFSISLRQPVYGLFGSVFTDCLNLTGTESFVSKLILVLFRSS